MYINFMYSVFLKNVEDLKKSENDDVFMDQRLSVKVSFLITVRL